MKPLPSFPKEITYAVFPAFEFWEFLKERDAKYTHFKKLGFSFRICEYSFKGYSLKPRNVADRYLPMFKSSHACKLCGIPIEYVAITRQNGVSRKCNYSVKFFSYHKGSLVLFNVDHIVPSSKGGLDITENKQTTCYACNAEKADQLLNVS